MSKRLGYEVRPSEDMVNGMGYQLLASGKAEAAIAVFRRNVEWYGDSANVHDSLGEALEASGQLDEALACYQRALQRGVETGKVNPAFQQHVERVLLKLAPAARTSGNGAP